MYVPPQSYGDHRRIWDVLAGATAQLAGFIHLIIRKPALVGRRYDVHILAYETLVAESTCFGDCVRLDSGGNLRRLVPQGRQIVVWEGPDTEARAKGSMKRR